MRALGVVLAASTDKKMSTEALRVYLGVAPLVWARSRNPETGEEQTPYVSLHEVYAHSGVKESTLSRHLGDLERLGLFMDEKGKKGWAPDKGSRGEATSWTLGWGQYEPLDAPRELLAFLDPSDGRWSQTKAASSGWRLAAYLLAIHGLVAADLRVVAVADGRGLTPGPTSRTLARLEAHTGLVSKQGNRWTYSPRVLAHCIEHGGGPLLDRRAVGSRFERVRKHEDWLRRRKEHVEEKRARSIRAIREHLGLPPVASTRDEKPPDRPLVEDW